MNHIPRIIILAVLFTMLIPTISSGQDNSTNLDVRQPLPVTLDIEIRADDGSFVTREVTVLVDLNIEDALRTAGVSQAQIDAIRYNPTVSTSTSQDVTAKAQIHSIQESSQPSSIGSANAVLPFSVTALRISNLYNGPGENYGAIASVTAGDSVTVTTSNADGRWYQLDNGYWIAASAVSGSVQVPTASSVTTAPLVPTPVPTSVPTVKPTALPTSAPTALPTSVPTAIPSGTIANRNANLRSGPGTNYPVSGGTTAGQALTITGQNSAGGWYQLASGAWIAAFLVDNAPSVGVVSSPPPPAASTPILSAPAVSNITPAQASCNPSYPTICIPINVPDLDCAEISERQFTVLQPDPHRFDGDKDGIGCER